MSGYHNVKGEPIDWKALAAKVPAQRKIVGGKRKPTVKNGYAAPPGGGPEGKTCGDCAHKRTMGNYGCKQYIKCELRKSTWTNGEGTDILARSPACSKFEAKS